ncbi:MAG: ABC-type uncharacterized transport system involved in gliding motility auxiliary subunit [Paraglaciecola sp.]|jgi:ABC-type uncharacterized transport system involved in gliding motility auxiliary subunit
MSRSLSTPLSMLLIAISFFALVLVNNQLLSPVRLDLTENQVYSLSSGSEKVLAEIDEPINLYFFFSDKASKNMTSLRNYASRVESLLQEYAKLAKGKINLEIIDPQAFSEQEDRANQFGLTAATIGTAGEAIYIGLAASNALGDHEVIPFFDPQQESFLEYEISKLIHQLSASKQVRLTLLTDLAVAGGQNPMSGQFDAPWIFYTQLQQLYQLEKIGSDAVAVPGETDVLILMHPNELSEALLFSIDQYVLAGGKLLVFVDPHHESDQLAMMAGGGIGGNSSNLLKLFNAWGVTFDAGQVLLDAMTGLDIRTASGGVARHFGFVGLGPEQIDREDVITSNLEIINGASFGTFSHDEQSQSQWLPLLHSSLNADLLEVSTYAMTRDPQELAKKHQDKNQQYVLAARIAGAAKSAFEQIPPGLKVEQQLRSTESLNVIVVGDSDLLADQFWVQKSNFFGQTITTPFANNGDFVTNAVENLGGSDALISIRSRGTFARPFIKVDELTVVAEQKFREQEQILQQQLEETESQLSELQSEQGKGGALLISPEQQQAVDDFIQQEIQIRKALREVRHQLDKDIESLGNWLKFINIALAPLILVLLLMLLARLLRTHSKPSAGVQRGVQG